jgi:hypothetical protein
MTKPTEPKAQRWLRGALRHLGGGEAVGTPDAVPVTLTLRWGDAPAAGNTPLAVRAAGACAQAVNRLLADFGIPGRAAASVILAGPGGADPYALRVNGRRACLAIGELDAIVADVAGAGTTIEEIPDTAVAEVATSVCVAALHSRLSVLLREDHVDRILSADEAYPYGMQVQDLTFVLAAVVDNGVSLRRSSEIRRILTDARGNESAIQLVELIIESLRSTSVDLLCAGQTMRRITTEDPDNPDLFIDLRTRIFNDIGIEFPDIHFVRDDGMPEEYFAFRFNAAVTSLRRLGEGEGLSKVVAILEQDLRRRAAWFITLTDLEELIGQLKLLPDTVQTVQVRYPRAWLSVVGRKALDEGLSLRQVSTLLDWTIDLDPEPLPAGDIRFTEGPAPIGLADGDQFPSPRDAVALIRQRWMEELVWARVADTPIYVRRLPAKLEQAAEVGSLMSDDSAQGKLAAIVQTMLLEDDAIPIVVPTLTARARLRDALAPEFPDLQVCAELEYPPAARLVELSPLKSATLAPNH